LAIAGENSREVDARKAAGLIWKDRKPSGQGTRRKP
jgi:hypothetical protein